MRTSAKQCLTPTRTALLLTLLGARLFANSGIALAQSPYSSATFVGTRRSGNFAFTFNSDGTYVYVGAIGTSGLNTQSSEQGVYNVLGDQLVVQRQGGRLLSSNGYTQNLEPQTTVYQWRLGNTPSGPGLQLIFPNGGAQIFYKQ